MPAAVAFSPHPQSECWGHDQEAMLVCMEQIQLQTSCEAGVGVRLNFSESEFPGPSRGHLPRKAGQKSSEAQPAWDPLLLPAVDLWASNFSSIKWGGAGALVTIREKRSL